MNKKLISALLAGLALSSVGPAQAAVINVSLSELGNASGSAVVQFSMFDMGTLYGANATCGTALACDGLGSVSTYKGVGAGATTFNEDSWGILSVTGIEVTSADASTTWKWSPGAGGYLSGMFYGIVDTSSTYSTSSILSQKTETQENTAIGGRVDIYQLADNTDFSLTTLTTGRTAQDDFSIGGGQTLKTAGTNWLTGDFDSYASSFTTVTTLTGPNAGSVLSTAAPDLFIDFIAGSVFSQWDTNGITTNPNNINATNDLGGSSTFNCSFNAVTGKYSCGTVWTTKGVASLDGNKIPEPGSMALVGLGLMGLAGLRRRKEKV